MDDLTRLAYLHEPGVLESLKCRYNLNEIYVSTNKWIPNLIFRKYERWMIVTLTLYIVFAETNVDLD